MAFLPLTQSRGWTLTPMAITIFPATARVIHLNTTTLLSKHGHRRSFCSDLHTAAVLGPGAHRCNPPISGRASRRTLTQNDAIRLPVDPVLKGDEESRFLQRVLDIHCTFFNEFSQYSIMERSQRTDWRMYLNNFLQGRYGHTRFLTWTYSQTGPPHDTRWLAVAYFNGIEHGRGLARDRGSAMEIAAETTFRALTARNN